MFTQLVVFATPPFALVKATFLPCTPDEHLSCLGPPQAPNCHAGVFSGISTTRHRERPSPTGLSAEPSLAIRGLGLGLYPYLVGARRKSTADVIAQLTAALTVVEPGFLGSVQVQLYVALGQ